MMSQLASLCKKLEQDPGERLIMCCLISRELPTGSPEDDRLLASFQVRTLGKA